MDILREGEEALVAGEAARREKRAADAVQAFAQAIACFRQARDEPRLAHALSRQAQVARDAEDLRTALKLQNEAVSLARRSAPSSLARLVRHLADILQQGGDPAAAAPLYAEMMELYGAAPETPPLELANAIRGLACNSEALGDRMAARRLWLDVRRRYLALDELFHDTYGLAENPGVIEADGRLANLASAEGPFPP